MYETCPKCGHRRADGEAAAADACPACGIVYAKWLKASLRDAAPAEHAEVGAAPTSYGRAFLDLLFHVETPVDRLVLAGRGLVWAGLLAWTAWFFGTDYTVVDFGSVEIGESFLHRINLVFHEAGHVLFIPFGDFMRTLGGSLGQLLMPLVVAGAFVLRHGNPFGGSVALWWLGQSAMDLAPYIADARAGRLLLLGGLTGTDSPDFHDWKRMLSLLGWLNRDLAIAGAVNAIGMGLMVVALLWGGWLLRLQFAGLARPR